MPIKKKKNGTEIRPVVTYESLFSMMKLMPFWVAVTLKHVQEAGDTSSPYPQQIATAP